MKASHVAVASAAFLAGIAVQAVNSQRASPVPDARTFCKYLTEHKPAGQAGINGIDFHAAMTLLACSVDEIDGRLRALEQRQRELGDPK